MPYNKTIILRTIITTVLMTKQFCKIKNDMIRTDSKRKAKNHVQIMQD